MPEAHVVAQPKPARRNIPFRLYAHEMHGYECSAKLAPFPGGRWWSAARRHGGTRHSNNRSECGICRMRFEVVVVVVANDAAFHAQVIGAGLGGKADFTEIADLFRQGRSQVQNQLSHVESADRSLLIGGREIHIAESPDLQRGEAALGVADFAHAGVLVVHRGRAGRGSGSGGGRRSRSFCGAGRGGCQRSLFLAITLLQLVDPVLQLLNALEQALHRRLARCCSRRLGWRRLRWRRRLRQQCAGSQ